MFIVDKHSLYCYLIQEFNFIIKNPNFVQVFPYITEHNVTILGMRKYDFFSKKINCKNWLCSECFGREAL